MEDVLCLITYEAVVILDMKAILESEDWNGECQVTPPPLKKLVKFEEENLPLAMGCLKLENTLYMFGGEFLTEWSYSLGGVRFGIGNFGKDVMKLDLCDPHSKPTCVGKLKGPKIFPMVFEFNAKIYILSGTRFDLLDSFEVWDPVTRESSSLPPPPTNAMHLSNYFLTERGIVVEDAHKWLFFDIDNMKWDIGPECPTSIPKWQDWVRSRGVQAPGYNDVFLRFDCEGTLFLNLLEPCLYQTCHLAENYRDLDVKYTIRDDFGRIADSSKQGQGLGPRYTCALLPCIDYSEKKMVIIIHVFRVEKNASSSKRPKLDCQEGAILVPGEELFSLISLRKQVYEFNFHIPRGGQYLFFVRHAFM